MKALAKSFQLAAATLVSVIALTACGGSGGGTSSTQASVPGAVASKGVITAKGSIFVNGIKYSTAGAVITVDDNPGVESDLKIGMTVKVRGTSDDTAKTGVATRIDARDALEGEIESFDEASKTITVMGQTVHIEDNLTRLTDDNTVKVYSAGLYAVGEKVEVHGFADDQGRLRATRVAKKTTGEFEAKGFVTGFVAGTTTFNLSLTPNGASFLTVNFTAGQLPVGATNGTLVEVKSAAVPAGALGAKTITASLIKLEDNRLGAENEKVEVEGIVSSGTLASFVVNGQQVITNSSTMFEGGLSTDFATGVKLEAEGPLNAAGAIVATKISFRSNIKIEADASSVTPNTSLTVLGKVVAFDTLTTRIDNGPVLAGSHVEVRAMPDSIGGLIATRIVVLSPSSKAFVQGPVTAADSAAGTLTILGFPLVSDAATQWRVSSSSSEVAVSKTTFFAQLTATSVVKAKWDPFTAVGAPIKEAEIELGK